jgi:hypothetical protein
MKHSNPAMSPPLWLSLALASGFTISSAMQSFPILWSSVRLLLISEEVLNKMDNGNKMMLGITQLVLVFAIPKNLI